MNREMRILAIAIAVASAALACGGAPKRSAATPDEGTVPSVRTLTWAEAVADVRQLVRYIEEAHPDPYLRGGGRVAFHRRVHGILSGMSEKGVTSAELLKRVRPLVASVRDGHTFIDQQVESTARRTAVELETVEERLYISGVFQEADRGVLGDTVVAVEGVPWEELVDRTKRFAGYDNTYNNLEHLREAILTPDTLEELLALDTPLTAVRIETASPKGERTVTSFPLETFGKGEPLRPASRVALPDANAADLGWGFLTADESVAILRVDSMMGYREAFEWWRGAGLLQSTDDYRLASRVRVATGDAPPADIDACIAALPSATETFAAMTAALREARTSTLIVDLRRNSGGNSLLADILAYFLYPLEDVAVTDTGYSVPRYSQLYFDNYAGSSIESLRQQSSPLLEVGDLDFGGEESWQRNRGRADEAKALARLREYLEEAGRKIPTFGAHRREKGDGAAWSGEVLVLTSASTYSAGFDLLVMLTQLGATSIGVPSSQAGNCFIDTLSFELDNSRLYGTISHKWSLKFPDDPVRGEVLRPDIELTYARLAAMGFDPNASVLLALEKIAGAQSPTVPSDAGSEAASMPGFASP